MGEENQQQVKQEPQQVKQELKEPQQVTTKDPKKVEACKRLAAINHKKREAKKREEQPQFTAGCGRPQIPPNKSCRHQHNRMSFALEPPDLQKHY